MAKKSKTQRAKASAARQARKAERENEEQSQEISAAQDDAHVAHAEEAEGKSKLGFMKKAKEEKSEKEDDASSKKLSKKEEAKKIEAKKPKKKRFQFLRDVKAELKRVTWPTKIDVLRWTGVVIAALVFFGVFVAILDNLIVTPLLVLISGADPSTINFFSFTETSVATDVSSGATSS